MLKPITVLVSSLFGLSIAALSAGGLPSCALYPVDTWSGVGLCIVGDWHCSCSAVLSDTDNYVSYLSGFCDCGDLQTTFNVLEAGCSNNAGIDIASALDSAAADTTNCMISTSVTSGGGGSSEGASERPRIVLARSVAMILVGAMIL